MRKLILGIIFLFFVITQVCCSDPFFTRDVSGTVQTVGSRYKSRGQDVGGSEKIAIRLDPFRASNSVVSAAGGADGLFIECLSTRCAILGQGDCAQFACRKVVRWAEPDVVQCKMEKTIACTGDNR